MTVTDSHDTTATPPGLTHERVGMFADAVFAIAITLLVIELPRPEGHVEEGGDRLAMAGALWHFLGEHSGEFLAFFIAFMVLWVAWRQHHTTFDQITRATPGMMLLHVPLLIFVVLLPYPTALIGENSVNPLSVALFAGSEAGLLLSQAALLIAAVRGGVLRPGADVTRLRIHAVRLIVIAVFWLITAGLTWLVDGVPLAWLLTPVVAMPAAKIARRVMS
ncbi:TMEM175 family protein [Streptosporangium sp. NPDC000396]|uniref:TMEM175 family protein n=1 Tax=Streptosporangium sp. NPDC000396 TaxID=3366185 RepID=UPI0036A17D5F